VGQKYFNREANIRLRGRKKYTKYNKINNTSENLRGERGKIVARGGGGCHPWLRFWLDL